MDFQVKKSEIGGNHISRWKKTINQVPLMSLDDKVATERKKKKPFWTLPKNRQGTVYVFHV